MFNCFNHKYGGHTNRLSLYGTCILQYSLALFGKTFFIFRKRAVGRYTCYTGLNSCLQALPGGDILKLTKRTRFSLPLLNTAVLYYCTLYIVSLSLSVIVFLTVRETNKRILLRRSYGTDSHAPIVLWANLVRIVMKNCSSWPGITPTMSCTTSYPNPKTFSIICVSAHTTLHCLQMSIRSSNKTLSMECYSVAFSV